MWPFTARESSPLTAVHAQAPEMVYSEFTQNRKEVDVNFSSMLWGQITNLAYANDCSMNSVVLALLFQEMYGRCAYGDLLVYADQLQVQQRQEAQLEVSKSSVFDILKSRERGTTVNLKYLGKADTSRSIVMPLKMHADLNRHASRQSGSPSVSVYLREVMYRILNGSVMHERWRNERSLVEGSRGL